MGSSGVLEINVLMHIEFAIPRKLTIQNSAYPYRYSCRWYQD